MFIQTLFQVEIQEKRNCCQYKSRFKQLPTKKINYVGSQLVETVNDPFALSLFLFNKFVLSLPTCHLVGVNCYVNEGAAQRLIPFDELPQRHKKRHRILPAMLFKLINGYQLTMLSKHKTARHSIITPRRQTTKKTKPC